MENEMSYAYGGKYKKRKQGRKPKWWTQKNPSKEQQRADARAEYVRRVVLGIEKYDPVKAAELGLS
jgi:hypothetical protein